MRFAEVECSVAVAEKLWRKDHVDLSEVDQVLGGEPYVRRGRDGLHYAMGQTEAGRYLVVVVNHLGSGRARVVTARDMDRSERGIYRRR